MEAGLRRAERNPMKAGQGCHRFDRSKLGTHATVSLPLKGNSGDDEKHCCQFSLHLATAEVGPLGVERQVTEGKARLSPGQHWGDLGIGAAFSTKNCGQFTSDHLACPSSLQTFNSTTTYHYYHSSLTLITVIPLFIRCSTRCLAP